MFAITQLGSIYKRNNRKWFKLYTQKDSWHVDTFDMPESFYETETIIRGACKSGCVLAYMKEVNRTVSIRHYGITAENFVGVTRRLVVTSSGKIYARSNNKLLLDLGFTVSCVDHHKNDLLIGSTDQGYVVITTHKDEILQTKYYHFKFKQLNPILKIVPHKVGTTQFYWVLTKDNVSREGTSSLNLFKGTGAIFPEEIADNDVDLSTICLDTYGRLWVAGFPGEIKCFQINDDYDNLLTVSFSTSFGHNKLNRCKNLMLDKNGDLVALTETGEVFRLETYFTAPKWVKETTLDSLGKLV